ncbi:putative transketolase C-terminal section [Peptoclostridium acidaminophilum DSM 3953]|uniref:Putative transketolase C-terminal section n=1 Tax=Peptoclostridium acidaminophilum DSM 3953 TaxID=1286171 RepID=W8TD24_PEPAC|nr:transketolase family protein [Peptoclostridium acidaminophilum]AHM55708.1 putative transketolase C-terminal section [Peptoclostridium acidaminophilum DSM 3953]
MSKIATRDAYGKALAKLGQQNSKVVVLDADLSKSTKTADFKEIFPERFFNMGIAEANLMGASAGLAAAGKIPFASTFAVFASGRGFEIIRNSICYPKLNVKICATHAGITVGEDGASHQALEDISIMRSLPNMSVIVPADGVETEKVIFSIAEYSGPVYTRLGRSGVPTIFSDDYEFVLGKGVQLTDGDDVAIIACGIMVAESLEAAKLLEEKGIKARVINMSSIKPIDSELIVKAARETGAIVTAEEHNIIGGLGSAVAEVLVEEYPVPVKRVGVNDTFGESGDPKELVVKYGLTANDIVQAAIKAIERKR